jgi:Mg/Co/Ni transporter MgtE
MSSNEVIIYIEQLKNNLIADELEYIPKNIKDEILQYQQLNDHPAG